MTVTLTGTASKVYDGTTTGILGPNHFTVDGYVDSGSLAVKASSVTYDSADAGTGIGVTATA